MSQLSNDSSSFLVSNGNILLIFVIIGEPNLFVLVTSFRAESSVFITEEESYISVCHMIRKHSKENVYEGHFRVSLHLPLSGQRYLKDRYTASIENK